MWISKMQWMSEANINRKAQKTSLTNRNQIHCQQLLKNNKNSVQKLFYARTKKNIYLQVVDRIVINLLLQPFGTSSFFSFFLFKRIVLSKLNYYIIIFFAFFWFLLAAQAKLWFFWKKKKNPQKIYRFLIKSLIERPSAPNHHMLILW